ncbi:MAG TPA: hypothetical protein VM580_34060 [Labilithrix sp.]|nr:hypothetical protein [Labilithrix sp.]
MKLAPLMIAMVALAACAEVFPPVTSYTTGDRDGLDTPVGKCCEHLRRLGCAEGFQGSRKRTCYESYTVASKLADVPITCLLAATTQSEIQACGDANSIRVRCIMPSAEVEGSHAP